MKSEWPQCARCGIPPADRLCQNENGRAPDFCPTAHCGPAVEAALSEMAGPDMREFARNASIQEAEGYGDRERGIAYAHPIKPRLLETIEFAKRMRYRRLGLAFCIGLRKEARVVEKLFTDNGFETVSVLCKLGRRDKGLIDIADDQKINVGAFEPMCNPIAQAMVMNEAETDFNVVLGLCVGHDALFFKYSDAMCTVLAAKDRLLGHNPLAAVYNIDSYYRSLKR